MATSAAILTLVWSKVLRSQIQSHISTFRISFWWPFDRKEGVFPYGVIWRSYFEVYCEPWPKDLEPWKVLNVHNLEWRIWTTLPNAQLLRRPLDVKQLKEQLSRRFTLCWLCLTTVLDVLWLAEAAGPKKRHDLSKRLLISRERLGWWPGWIVVFSNPSPLCCEGSLVFLYATKAGNGNILTQSAVYPREFGIAIAGLMPSRGSRPREDGVDLLAYQGVDHLGSLDDLIKGREKAWWRQLNTTK